jgi:hypothetical protein
MIGSVGGSTIYRLVREPMPVCIGSGLSPVADIDLAEDVRNVPNDCVPAQEQFVGDFLIRMARCDKPKHLDFPSAQTVREYRLVCRPHGGQALGEIVEFANEWLHVQFPRDRNPFTK